MKRFKNILFVFESEMESRAALERAVTLAQNNQARLTVIEVMDQPPSAVFAASDSAPAETMLEAMLAERRQTLQRLVESIPTDVHVETRVLAGTPFLEIIKEVLQGQRDLVMKAAHRDSTLDRLFGSNDMHLLRNCPCPVWLIKPAEVKSYRRILAAVDSGGEVDKDKKNALNRQILETATSLAHSEFCELHVVHVWQLFGESALRSGFIRVPKEDLSVYLEEGRQQHLEWLNGLMDDLTAWVGSDAVEYAKPKLHLLKGNAREVIPQLAGELGVDLIVMGTLARTGIPGFIMGNTAETILTHIDCSVLAVKPGGFATPVKLEN